jgi:hypothetical protein
MHKINTIIISNNTLYVDSELGEFYYNIKELSNLLANASDIQLSQYTISPSKYGIHWQLLDEDISIQALLKESLKEKSIS